MIGRWVSCIFAFTWSAHVVPSAAAVFDISANGAQTRAAAVDVFGVAPSVSVRPSAPVRYAKAFAAAAERYDLSQALLVAVARQESGLRADAVSPAGAIGVMQLMPKTASRLGVDPHDPAQNIMGGAAYLRQMLDRFGGHLDLALAAYNGGPGVAAHVRRQPRETRAYVADCLDRLARSPFAVARSNSTK